MATSFARGDMGKVVLEGVGWGNDYLSKQAGIA